MLWDILFKKQIYTVASHVCSSGAHDEGMMTVCVDDILRVVHWHLPMGAETPYSGINTGLDIPMKSLLRYMEEGHEVYLDLRFDFTLPEPAKGETFMENISVVPISHREVDRADAVAVTEYVEADSKGKAKFEVKHVVLIDEVMSPPIEIDLTVPEMRKFTLLGFASAILRHSGREPDMFMQMLTAGTEEHLVYTFNKLFGDKVRYTLPSAISDISELWGDDYG